MSDGAGSATHGGQGASLLCRSLVLELRSFAASREGLPDDDLVMVWLDDFRDRLAAIAEARGTTRRQFAATLVMLIVRDGRVLAAQIGDSAMAARTEGRWEAICWPENGEFASTTYFVTDDPEVRLRTAHFPLEHDAFALFSDGLEGVALDHLALEPHARFLQPMMRPVDAATGAGRLPALSSALGRYLDGAALCERTDDDKTIILLSGA